MQRNNVLHVNEAEERAGYVSAVHEIIRTILADHNATLIDISEKIGVSLGTISNAFNKKGVLNPLFLNRLAKAYGVHHLDPYAKLSGGRVIPLEAADDGDVLPFITLAGHRIATARCPSSPAGSHETLSEQLGYLPDLRRLQREIGSLIVRIEARSAAA